MVGFSYVSTVTGTPEASWNIIGDVTLGDIVTLGENGWFVIGQVSVPDLSGYATIIDSEAGDQLLSDRLAILESDPTTQTILNTVNQNLTLRLDELERDPVTKAYVDSANFDQDVEINAIKSDYIGQDLFNQEIANINDSLDLKADKANGVFEKLSVVKGPSSDPHDGSFSVASAAGDQVFNVYGQRNDLSNWEPDKNYVFYKKDSQRIRDWLSPATLDYSDYDGLADEYEIPNIGYLRDRVRPYIDASDEALRGDFNDLIAGLQSSSAMVFRGRIDATTESPDGALDYGKLTVEVNPTINDGNDARPGKFVLNHESSDSVTAVILNHDTLDQGRKNWHDIFESGSKMLVTRTSDSLSVTLTVEPGSQGGQTGRGYSFEVIEREGPVFTFADGDELTVTLIEKDVIVGDVWVNTTAGTATPAWGLTEDVNEGDLLAYGGGAWAVVGASVVPDLSHLETKVDSQDRDDTLETRIGTAETELGSRIDLVEVNLASETSARESAILAEEALRAEGDEEATATAIEYVDSLVDRLFKEGEETVMSSGYNSVVANFSGNVDAVGSQIKFNNADSTLVSRIAINHDSDAGRINWLNVFADDDTIRITNQSSGQTVDFKVKQTGTAGPSARTKNFEVISVIGSGLINSGDLITIKALAPEIVSIGRDMEVEGDLSVSTVDTSEVGKLSANEARVEFGSSDIKIFSDSVNGLELSETLLRPNNNAAMALGEQTHKFSEVWTTKVTNTYSSLTLGGQSVEIEITGSAANKLTLNKTSLVVGDDLQTNLGSSSNKFNSLFVDKIYASSAVGDLSLTGHLAVSESLTTDGDLTVKGGHIYFHKTGSTSNMVFNYDPEDTYELNGAVAAREPARITCVNGGLRLSVLKNDRNLSGWDYDFNNSTGAFEAFVYNFSFDSGQSDIKAPALGGETFSWGGLYLEPGRTDQAGNGGLFRFTVNEDGATYSGPIEQPTSLVTKEWVELNGGGGGGGGGSLVILNTNPSSPAVGQQWYNTADNALYIRIS